MRAASGCYARASLRAGTTWLLVALVLVPSISGPMGALADLRPGPVAGRDGLDPASGDSDPLEESESEPLEDPAEEAPGSEFLHPSSVSFPRVRSRGLPRLCGPRADRHHRGISGPRHPEKSPLAGSGRMLRRWLQSHVC